MTKDQVSKPTRRLRRFYLPSRLPETGKEVVLPSDQTHHLAEVHRLKVGDKCYLLDGSGQMAEATIQSITKLGEAQLRIENLSAIQEHPIRIYAYVGIPQRGKIDSIIEKAQELGVEAIFPIETERTIVKMSASNKDKVVARWQRIAQETSKQAYSLNLVEISPPLSFDVALDKMTSDGPVAVFDPGQDAVAFREWAQELDQTLQKSKETGKHPAVHVWIGPEGGFTDDEVEKLLKKPRAKQVCLGDTVLKVDTAFIGVCATLQFLFGSQDS